MLSKYTSLATFPTLDHKPSNDTWHVIKVCATDSLTVGNGWSVWAFYIYQEIPEIPVGLQMEHDFSVRSTGKFLEKVELLKRYSRFPVGIFRLNCVFHLRVSQRFTSSRPLYDHIFGKEI